jgi:hypothetical protein
MTASAPVTVGGCMAAERIRRDAPLLTSLTEAA